MMKAVIQVLVVLFFFQACQPNAAVVIQEDCSLELIVPSHYVTAGNAISVQIVNKEKLKGSVSLVLKSSLSVNSYEVLLKDDIQDFDIPKGSIKDAGLYECYLMNGNAMCSYQVFEVRASDIVDPINLYTGPNSIWVNDLQQSMVVALPKDRYSNAGREGDSLKFDIRMPDGNNRAQQIKIKNQLAFDKINSEYEAGKIFSAVSTTSANSKEQRIDAIELWPLAFEIEVVDVLLYADHRQFFELKTDVLKDINGDIVPDGTLVKFVSTQQEVKAKYQSYTIDGIAKVFIRNPMEATDCKIYAQVGTNSKSNIIELSFESNIDKAPFEFTNNELIVGPISSFIGQYVPDGTRVFLIGGEKEIFEETEDGFASFKKLSSKDGLSLRIGGTLISLSNE